MVYEPPAAAVEPGARMTTDSEALADFRRLLEATAQPGPDSPVLLSDGLVGPEAGALLRRCAVPHDFNRALLQRLGGLGEAEASARFEQFADLSIMQRHATTLSVHERWRQPLWRWWQEDAQRADFVALSETLVEWFTAPPSPTGEDPAARRRMFHLIGCRHAEGMQAFEALFRTARHRRRFSECSLLLRLVHEYDPGLKPRELALLRYHEGKIAIDLRQWERALPLLRAVAADPHADARLGLNGQVRVAHCLRQTGRTEEALVLLEAALTGVAAEPAAARSRWRVLHELGEVYRDLGRADDASATLAKALASINDDEEDADIAGMLNSLGTVQLKLREIESAIASFNASLNHLKSRGDAVRTGGVLNNLGLAQIECCDWKAAEDSFAASLETKRASGDQIGQATTLLNLSRVQLSQERLDDARRSAEQAAALYAAGGDERGRTLAEKATARVLSRPRPAPGAAQALVGSGSAAAAAQAGPAKGAAKRGLPWWAWGAIGLGVLFAALVAAS